MQFSHLAIVVAASVLACTAAPLNPEPVPQARFASNPVGSFAPRSADASRGPCPALNALANHGFLPRIGKGITEENLIQAFQVGTNYVGYCPIRACLRGPNMCTVPNVYITVDWLRFERSVLQSIRQACQEAFFPRYADAGPDRAAQQCGRQPSR